MFEAFSLVTKGLYRIYRYFTTHEDRLSMRTEKKQPQEKSKKKNIVSALIFPMHEE